MPGIRLEGGPALERKLAALDSKVARKLSRQALRAGAKVVLAQAKANAPKRTGLLRRSLKVRAGKARKGFTQFRVQTAAGSFKGETFYGAFVEFGHKIGKRSSALRDYKRATGQDPRGEVPANPFIARAFRQKREAALQVIIATLKQGIK